MIKKALFFVIGLILCVSIFSQDQNDTIQTTKVFGGYKFEKNGQVLTLQNMLDLMKDNPDAYSYLEKAKASAGFANVLGFAGGFMIGWPLGTAIGGGNPNWTLAVVGCGLIIVTIPISRSANKNTIIAVDKFNKSRKGLTYNNQYDIRLGLSQNGLGFKIRF
jgi:hypothetical protein